MKNVFNRFAIIFLLILAFTSAAQSQIFQPPDRIQKGCSGGFTRVLTSSDGNVYVTTCVGGALIVNGSAIPSGSGTANRIAMWTAGSTLGNSPFANNSNNFQIITNNAFLQGVRTNSATINLIGVDNTNNLQIGSANLAAGGIFIGCGTLCTGRTDIRNGDGSTDVLSVGSAGTGYFAVGLPSGVQVVAVPFTMATNDIAIRGTTSAAAIVDLLKIDASNRTVLGNTTGIIYTPASAIDFNVNGAPSIGNAGFGGAKVEFVNTGAIRFSTSTGSTNLITTTQSFTASSGIQSGFNLTPVIGQSGTAGYCLFCANVTETTTGSGSKLLFDLQVGSAVKFRVDNAGTVILGANNNFIRGTTTGAVNADLIGVDNSDDVIVGNGTLDTTILGGSTSALVRLTTGDVATLGDVNNVGQRTKFQSDDSTAIAEIEAATRTTITSPVVRLNDANYQSCTALTTNASGDIGCTPSDAQIKKSIVPFNKGLKALSTIIPKSYTFSSGFLQGSTRTGFMAQNVAESLPEAVSETGAGMKQIDNVTVTATLVNAVKELSQQVEQLQKEIANLKAQKTTTRKVKRSRR